MMVIIRYSGDLLFAGDIVMMIKLNWHKDMGLEKIIRNWGLPMR